ncbi:hypothetical protein [Phocaeicola plebeius]|uniref:hypothetical protein n=1 Tax=Phocaeicola plebeius TaxID=310297 RepID=UPI004027883F
METIEAINLNKLRDEAYQNAVEHGWHDEDLSTEHFLCLVISELMEAVQAERKGKHADRIQFENYMSLRERSDEEFKYAFAHGIKDSVEDELADVCIRIFDLAGLRGVDFSKVSLPYAINEKHIKELSKITFTKLCYDVIVLTGRYSSSNFPIGILLADILNDIYCISKIKGFDLLWHIEQKMKYNRTRPRMHGNNKF